MIAATEPQELLSECNVWLENLRDYREKLIDLRNKLYLWAPGKTDHDQLKNVEHFHNQFHIQLINIHDEKHQIREHMHQVEHHPNFGHKIPHHKIGDDLKLLMHDLDNLETEFNTFISG